MDERKRAKESEKSSRIRRRRRGQKKSKRPESGIIPSLDLGLFGDWLSSSLISWFVLDCWVLIKRGSYRITLERHDVCACTCWRPHTHQIYIYLPRKYSCETCRANQGSRESWERPLQWQTPHTQTDRNQHRATINIAWTQRTEQNNSQRVSGWKRGRYVGRPTVNSKAEGLWRGSDDKRFIIITRNVCGW